MTADASELRRLFEDGWTVGDLVRFHSAYKLLLMAHSPAAYRALGSLVGSAASMDRGDVERRYSEQFVAALASAPTRGTHTNVLQHMAGYFTDRLDAGAKAELFTAIDDYQRGDVPLTAPLTLIRRHVETFGIDYLASQVYLRT